MAALPVEVLQAKLDRAGGSLVLDRAPFGHSSGRGLMLSLVRERAAAGRVPAVSRLTGPAHGPGRPSPWLSPAPAQAGLGAAPA